MQSPPTSTDDDSLSHKEEQQQQQQQHQPPHDGPKPSNGGDRRYSNNEDIERATTEQEFEISSDDDPKGAIAFIYDAHRRWFHLGMWLIFTGFLAAAYILQVPKGYDPENLILGLIYAWFSMYLFFQYVPASHISRQFWSAWHTAAKPALRLNKRWRLCLYALLVTAVLVATVFSFPEKTSTRKQRLISLCGMAVIILLLTASSRVPSYSIQYRKAINWFTVCSALLLQFLLALFVFRSSVGHDIFQWMSNFTQGFLGMARHGTAFLTNDEIADSSLFVVVVFPAVVFFSAVVQMLYHLGTLQWVFTRFAVVFMTLLHVSGIEAIVATASPFVGQGENALLVRPYLPHATKAELHQIMTCGFSTVAGAMLAGYMALGVSGEALLTSCIMSIPCSLAVSKIRYPETEQDSLTGQQIKIPPPDPTNRSSSILHALANGASIGISVSLCIAANIIAILSLLHAINAGLTWLGHFVNIQSLTLQLITGYIFVPMAWLIGADNTDVVAVGQLMALKIWANEYVAYQEMMSTYAGQLSERSMLVTTYALCGFANVPGLGIQIGTLGALAPGRTGDISRLAVSSMLCGFVSTCLSAAMAGMLS